MYCAYCGRVIHRCQCEMPDSRIKQFLQRRSSNHEYRPQSRNTPYKRGVPPQVKKRERATMRRNYSDWYTILTEQYGEHCCNCGAQDSLIIDHMIPIAKGGKSEPENLQLLCATCNQIKGKLVIDCR